MITTYSLRFIILPRRIIFMQQLREATFDYDSFVKSFSEIILQMMGKDYSIRIFKVIKNDSLEQDSLILCKSGTGFSPGIYLMPYYKEYSEGADIFELAARLCASYKRNEEEKAEDGFTYTLENVKKRIIYRLLSYEKNKKLLEKIPHIKYLDLAVTYYCLLQNDESRISAIRITNEHLQSWNISVNELHKLAANNTKREFPPVILSVDDVIHTFHNEERVSYSNAAAEKILKEKTNISNEQINSMYVLSNSAGIYGAACLLYKNLLRDFSAKVQADLYILPSSIHELIIIANRKDIDKDELALMVRSINRTHLAYDEVLSDNVYYYSREYNAILQ